MLRHSQCSSRITKVAIFLRTMLIFFPPAGGQYFPARNYFPSCVAVLDVYPYPNSILRPIGMHEGNAIYTIHITFSKYIATYNLDSYVLTPSLTTDNLAISAKHVGVWRGSERTIILSFHVNELHLGTS